MINMIRPRVAEKSLDFLVSVDSAIPARIFGDDIRLRQILMNLLSNAVKYTRAGYISIEVGMEKIDDSSLKLICTVEDSGIGIKPEDQGRLFKEFSRIDIKTNQSIEGTGLGLVITAALCRAMGGDIKVFSEYGKGSVFEVAITQTFKSGETVAAVSNPETKRVLFFDWRNQYAQSIVKALESLRVDFTYSSALQDFLSELQYGEYDFAFVPSKYAMDCIHIPGMRKTPLQLVLMVEPGEISLNRELTSILLPVYSVTIANVLNNVSGEPLFHDKNNTIRFTAPEAKILIVDDITTNLRVAKELMSPYGAEIHTCMSGPEAIAKLKNKCYDIVFMDHMMPGMDGLQATAIIRALEHEDGYFRKVPIIALTANAVYGQKEKFLANGIDDFLSKPIEIERLNEILEKWLPPEKRIDSVHVQSLNEEKIEFPGIYGVDVPLGLKNCGGNISVYANILEDFCKDAESKLVQINEAFAGKDSKTYITLVHALKGAALSIGATETGEKALWLEQTAESANIAALYGKTAELHENVQTLIGNIRAAADRAAVTVNKERVEINPRQLEDLKTALANMDIEAVNRLLLTFAEMPLDEKTKSSVAELEQLILMFEYEKAIEKIDMLF
jgi:CheY-like chemotaxis protein